MSLWLKLPLPFLNKSYSFPSSVTTIGPFLLVTFTIPFFNDVLDKREYLPLLSKNIVPSSSRNLIVFIISSLLYPSFIAISSIVKLLVILLFNSV